MLRSFSADLPRIESPRRGLHATKIVSDRSRRRGLPARLPTSATRSTAIGPLSVATARCSSFRDARKSPSASALNLTMAEVEARSVMVQNIYQAVIENHAKSVVSKKRLSAADAIRNPALCAAVHKSAQNGGKIISVED